MNFIKKLQEENRQLREALKTAKDGLWNLESYVHSEKYAVNPYVLNKDVSHRIGETLANILSVEPYYPTPEPRELTKEERERFSIK